MNVQEGMDFIWCVKQRSYGLFNTYTDVDGGGKNIGFESIKGVRADESV